MTVVVDNGLALNSEIEVKLATIQVGATANSTDAQLRDRATHTSTQLAATVSDFAPTVRATALTGLNTATATAITAADTVLISSGKLQGQINARELKPRVPQAGGRWYGNNPFGTPFSASVVAALQRRTAFFEPHFDLTIDQIGLFITLPPPSVAKIRLAVYEMDAANSSQLNLLHTFAEITVDTTMGAKIVSGSYTFLRGRTYVFVHNSDAALNVRNVSIYAGLSVGLITSGDSAPSNFFFEDSVTYAAPPATINTATMSLAGSNPTLILMRAA